LIKVVQPTHRSSGEGEAATQKLSILADKRYLMREMNARTRIVASKDQVSCDLAGESIILNLKNGIYYGLNPMGARIWSLIQERRRVDEVRDQILDEYEVEREVCERELLALLSDLEENGLIDVERDT